MASLLDNLIIRIGADSEPLSKELRKAMGNLRSFGAVASDLGSKLAIGITAPLTAIGVKAVQSAADMDALSRGLVAVSDSAAEAQQQMGRLKEVAKLPGLGFKEAVEGAINLRAVGYSAAQSERYLMVFGNALASVGRGRADLQGVIVQLQQMSGKSKVLSEDVKPLIQRVPQLASAMKNLWNTIDTEALQAKGVSTKEFIEKIIEELAKLPKHTGGLKNDLENLSDKIQQTMAKLGEAIAPAVSAAITALEPMLERVAALAEAFVKLPQPVQIGVIAIGALAVAAGPVLFAIGQMSTGLVTLSSLAHKAGGGFTALAGGVGATKVQLIAAIPLIGMAIQGLYEFISGAYASSDAMKDSAAALKQQNEGRQRLIEGLRKQGVAVEELAMKLKFGKITTLEFDKQVRELAIVHGNAARAAGLQAGVVYDLGKAFKTLNVTPATELKQALLDARDAYKQMQNARASGDKGVSDFDLARAKMAVADAERALTMEVRKAEPVHARSYQLTIADLAAKKAYQDQQAQLVKSHAARKEAVAQENQTLHELSMIEAGMPEFAGNATKAWQAQKAVMESLDPVVNRLIGGLGSFADMQAKMGPLVDMTNEKLAAVSKASRDYYEALKTLGIRDTEEELQKMQEAFDAVAKETSNGANNLRVYEQALIRLIEAKAAHGVATKGEIEQLEKLKTATESQEKTAKRTGDVLRKQVSTIVTDLSRGVAQAIVSGEKLSKVFQKVAQDIAAALIRLVIEKAIGQLVKALDGVITKLGGVGGALAKVFGGLGGSKGTVASQIPLGGTVPGAASIPGGASSAGASAASGAVGLIGAIGSVGSMVTGIISNLQNMAMNKTLDEINRQVIFANWQSENTHGMLENRLSAIHQRLAEMRQIGIGVFNQPGDDGLRIAGAVAGAGGGSVTLNMEGANFIGFRDLDGFLDEVVKRLKQRGI